MPGEDAHPDGGDAREPKPGHAGSERLPEDSMTDRRQTSRERAPVVGLEHDEPDGHEREAEPRERPRGRSRRVSSRYAASTSARSTTSASFASSLGWNMSQNPFTPLTGSAKTSVSERSAMAPKSAFRACFL